MTPSRQVEARLSINADAQWRELFEHSPVMYLLVDPVGTVLAVNAYGAAQLGYAVGELVGQSVLNVVFPDDKAAASKNLELCVQTPGAQNKWEMRKLRRDGTQIWVRENAKAVRRSDGDLIVLIACEDITDRKRAEEALRESEARYRDIFETAGVSIWEEDFSSVKAATDELKARGVRDLRAYLTAHPEFLRAAISLVRIVDVNDATVKLFKAASKKELLDSLHVIFTPEAENVFAEELIALAEGRTSFASETTLQTLKGEKLAVLFIMTFPPPPAEPNRVLVTVMDITERKRAEILTAQVFETAPDGICIVGRDYRYRRANPVYSRRWGAPGERIIGMHVSELLGVDAFECTLKGYLDRCFAGEEVTFEWVSEYRGRLYLAVSYSPLRLGSQEVEAALVVQRDLTEYMRASDELRAAQAELAHVNRVATMGQLTASIAHEVNQPIAATVTNAQAALRWLDRGPLGLEEVRQTLAQIAKDGNRAADVIGRIRALIQKTPPRKDPLDINGAIREVIELTRGEALKNNVSVRAELADGLPLVQGDRVELQQVILNLIVNAVEAMTGVGADARELWISAGKDESGDVLVAVRDSGPGLTPTALEQLFQPFYTTKSTGLGLGLSICHSIVEAHGGRLSARANVPRGAIFQFTVPVI